MACMNTEPSPESLGFCVCVGGRYILNLKKSQLIYTVVFHISIWRGLELFLGGLSPPKTHEATALYQYEKRQ